MRALASGDPLTRGGLIVTSNRWNAWANWVGFLPVRSRIETYERPYSAELDNGRFAVAARLSAGPLPPHPEAGIGEVIGVASASELERCEDALLQFFQLPLLLQASTRLPPILGAPTYPLWGEIYYAEPPIDDRFKRYVVVSPHTWNNASGLVTVVRTTSREKYESDLFPEIQSGNARACCGEASTVPHRTVKFGPRAGRPNPMIASRADMVSIARGLIATHDLAASARRAGLIP